MKTREQNPPLVVIVGETASGKSALAIELAEKLNGEIICADSRTVYKGMDIGTAKPSSADRRRVPHHGLDLADPDEQFTAAQFKTYAVQAIEEIAGRGHLPIMVGGSGLYIDAVIFDYEFMPVADPALRAELQLLSVDELQNRLRQEDIPLPANVRNPRHLIRAVETGGRQAVSGDLRPRTLVLGLSTERPVLEQRIKDRVEAMVEAGFVTEIKDLVEKYGWQAAALQAPGYKAFRGYMDGTQTLEQAKAAFVHNDLQLAKRQRTWFKRNKSIHWLTTEDKQIEAVDIATTYLSKSI